MGHSDGHWPRYEKGRTSIHGITTRRKELAAVDRFGQYFQQNLVFGYKATIWNAHRNGSSQTKLVLDRCRSS